MYLTKEESANNSIDSSESEAINESKPQSEEGKCADDSHKDDTSKCTEIASTHATTKEGLDNETRLASSKEGDDDAVDTIGQSATVQSSWNYDTVFDEVFMLLCATLSRKDILRDAGEEGECSAHGNACLSHETGELLPTEKGSASSIDGQDSRIVAAPSGDGSGTEDIILFDLDKSICAYESESKNGFVESEASKIDLLDGKFDDTSLRAMRSILIELYKEVTRSSCDVTQNPEHGKATVQEARPKRHLSDDPRSKLILRATILLHAYCMWIGTAGVAASPEDLAGPLARGLADGLKELTREGEHLTIEAETKQERARKLAQAVNAVVTQEATTKCNARANTDDAETIKKDKVMLRGIPLCIWLLRALCTGKATLESASPRRGEKTADREEAPQTPLCFSQDDFLWMLAESVYSSALRYVLQLTNRLLFATIPREGTLSYLAALPAAELPCKFSPASVAGQSLLAAPLRQLTTKSLEQTLDALRALGESCVAMSREATVSVLRGVAVLLLHPVLADEFPIRTRAMPAAMIAGADTLFALIAQTMKAVNSFVGQGKDSTTKDEDTSHARETAATETPNGVENGRFPVSDGPARGMAMVAFNPTLSEAIQIISWVVREGAKSAKVRDDLIDEKTRKVYESFSYPLACMAVEKVGELYSQLDGTCKKLLTGCMVDLFDVCVRSSQEEATNVKIGKLPIKLWKRGIDCLFSSAVMGIYKEHPPLREKLLDVCFSFLHCASTETSPESTILNGAEKQVGQNNDDDDERKPYELLCINALADAIVSPDTRSSAEEIRKLASFICTAFSSSRSLWKLDSCAGLLSRLVDVEQKDIEAEVRRVATPIAVDTFERVIASYTKSLKSSEHIAAIETRRCKLVLGALHSLKTDKSCVPSNSAVHFTENSCFFSHLIVLYPSICRLAALANERSIRELIEAVMLKTGTIFFGI